MPLPFPKKKVPTIIEPCPIMDASVEVRFETDLPSGAIFGILYSAFQHEYTVATPLPIQQMPADFIAANDQLKYQPHYQIKNENFVVQIGPNVLTVGCISTYPGWNTYKGKIADAITKLQNSGITKGITRLGLRYINFFENIDIFEQLNSEVFSRNPLLISRSSFVRTEFMANEVMHLLQISSAGTLIKDGETKYGSLIDIDVSSMINLDKFFETAEVQIAQLHDAEKDIFFGLLSQEYLDTFKPIYD